MYRNSYLQLYKTTANTNPNITLLLTHFTQIYNTLGCVLQDLEFQIGKIIAEQAQPSIDLKQQYQMYKKNKKGDIQHREKEKEIIKVQESSIDQNVWKNMAENQSKNLKSEANNKGKGKDLVSQIKKEDHISQISGGSWIDSFIHKSNKNPKEGKERDKRDDIREFSPQNAGQKPRNDSVRQIGNDSFDSLFEITDRKREKSQRMEIQHPQYRSPLPEIPQASFQHSQSGREVQQVQATEQDFFQRIFKEGDSRKSK